MGFFPWFFLSKNKNTLIAITFSDSELISDFFLLRMGNFRGKILELALVCHLLLVIPFVRQFQPLHGLNHMVDARLYLL